MKTPGPSKESGAAVLQFAVLRLVGGGATASAEDAQQMCAHIRSVIETIKKSAAEEVRIQYGGSVNASNAGELMSMPDIDGALVGGASLDAASFARVVSFQDT